MPEILLLDEYFCFNSADNGRKEADASQSRQCIYLHAHAIVAMGLERVAGLLNRPFKIKELCSSEPENRKYKKVWCGKQPIYVRHFMRGLYERKITLFRTKCSTH